MIYLKRPNCSPQIYKRKKSLIKELIGPDLLISSSFIYPAPFLIRVVLTPQIILQLFYYNSNVIDYKHLAITFI